MTTTGRPVPKAGLHAFAVPDRVRLIGIPLLVALVQVGVTAIAAGHQDDVRAFDAGAVALLLAGPAALLLRRTRPAPTLVLALVATMAYDLFDYPEGPVYLALLTAFVNAVMRGRRAVAWASLPVGYLISAWVSPLVTEEGPWPDWSLVAGLGAWLLVLGAVTELARARLERSAEQARARDEAARRRASEERLLIARELHDVLAHNISLINVRAGVALHLLDERPDRVDVDQVRPALAAIKDASKDALGELRSVLDVLRQNEPAPLAPTAGLGDLDALAERGRGAGLDVRVERTNGSGTGLPAADLTGGLPAGVDLAAYRIAQEAVTNVIRHAGASRVTLRVRRTDDELEVRVDDDGHGARAGGGDPPAAPARGRGIAGMRERAQALGGTLDAGPRRGRGFRVLARFPLRGDE